MHQLLNRHAGPSAGAYSTNEHVPTSKISSVSVVFRKYGIQELMKNHSKSAAIKLTAKQLGIGERTVWDIVKEIDSIGNTSSPPKKRSRTTIYDDLDEGQNSAIVQDIRQSTKILDVVNADDTLPELKRTTLWKVLKKLGFKWEKRSRNNMLIERQDIILWRRWLWRYAVDTKYTNMVLDRGNFNIIQAVSDFLSVVTITICFLLKVPQILTLIKVKHARGINLIGLLMELTSYTVMFSYNFRSGYALLTYMEYPIILIQELILILIVVIYKGYANVWAFILVQGYVMVTAGFLTGIIPREILTFLVPLCTPIGASSKVVQLLEIIRLKNADSVSLLTWFISAFTNFTRIVTIFLDSGDLTLLLNFSVNTALSTSIMCTAYYFKAIYKPKED
ncbi:PQ loop repeat [Popillia japonica]|uniref:PQ loop repeat n=1 Tax=Popillia japonica TaxID=7064 RepID=A0AAW1J0F3_POPJA